MDLARMRVFQAVADEGSFSRAARALFLSQPAITQHVHALEAELGVPLFDRLGRRTSLTPAGASLAPLAPYVLPPLLGDLQRRLPAIELRLTVGDSAELLLALLNNDVELAFWLREATHPHLDQTVFLDEPLVWVLPPNDRQGQATGLPAQAFPGRRLILRKRNSAARRVIQALLEREQAFPPNVLEMDNLEAIKRSVEVGFGISIVPRSAVVREKQAGTLSVVPLQAPDASITSSYAQYAGRRLSAPARAFVEVLETLRR